MGHLVQLRDGAVEIPAAIRSALGILPHDPVRLWSDGRSLVIAPMVPRPHPGSPVVPLLRPWPARTRSRRG